MTVFSARTGMSFGEGGAAAHAGANDIMTIRANMPIRWKHRRGSRAHPRTGFTAGELTTGNMILEACASRQCERSKASMSTHKSPASGQSFAAQEIRVRFIQ
jgi:hypothetical protein